MDLHSLFFCLILIVAAAPIIIIQVARIGTLKNMIASLSDDRREMRSRIADLVEQEDELRSEIRELRSRTPSSPQADAARVPKKRARKVAKAGPPPDYEEPPLEA